MRRGTAVAAAVIVAALALVLAGCSSGGGKATPATGDPQTSTSGSPVATRAVTAAASAPPAGDAGLNDQLRSVMQSYISAIDDANYDAALGYYSRCARRLVTLENLRFGAQSTGRLTLVGVTGAAKRGDNAASAFVETTSEFRIGSQSRFVAQSYFLREDGQWKLDSGGSGPCTQP